MNQMNEIYKLISIFLNRKDTVQEKKELLDWFEKQSEDGISETEFAAIQHNARVSLIKDIQNPERKIIQLRTARYIAVAASVILVGFSILQFWPKPEILATTAQLASIPPGKERAIIILGNGKRIDLEHLSLNQSIQTGDVIIKKDGTGQISYHDVKTGQISIQKNSMYTPKGATYDLTLSDGTLVTLNADSKISYPTSFDNRDREVELQGEAYFHVQKTINRSKFIVKTRGQKIVVLGTRFNVNAYPETDRTQTTLEEGSVMVSAQDVPQSNIYLKPNEQATLQHGTLNSRHIDIEEVLSWKKGQFYFNGNNTEEVMQQIARWYNIDIIYKRSKSKEEYTGTIPRNLSLNKLIELLNYADLNTKALMGDNSRIKLIIT
ncbi:FecR family protein [Sphingobacterium multivorum]|uniref:FecR family protein n=1 Tax=Sphingobacterium multivorum TaxID=28454 RepID=UPI0028AC7203|nr:FecR domain-containing protein [Sphingobacterium multivorum]